MQVYNIKEAHPCYTTYDIVDLEDADGEFVTEEEMEEMKDLPGVIYSSWHSIMYNNDEIAKLVQEGVDKYESRDKKRVTVLFNPDYGDYDIKSKVRDGLLEHNLRLIGDRIRLDTRVTLSYDKGQATKGICEILESYFINKLDIDLKLNRMHLKKNQTKIVAFSVKLGITLEDIIEYVELPFDTVLENGNKRGQIWYTESFNDTNGRIFATEWYNKVVEKLNKTVD